MKEWVGMVLDLCSSGAFCWWFHFPHFCSCLACRSHRDVAQRIASFLDVPFFEAAAAVEGAAAEQPEPPR